MPETVQISQICRHARQPACGQASARTGGCLRAVCRSAATVRDGSWSAATAGRSRHGEHPSDKVNMAETLIAGACQQPQSAESGTWHFQANPA